MPTLQLFIYIIGFLFLMYMAWSLWTEKPSNIEEIEPMPAKKQILFALSVSLLNPHAIMDTVGVIGTSASVYDGYDKVVFSLAQIEHNLNRVEPVILPNCIVLFDWRLKPDT